MKKVQWNRLLNEIKDHRVVPVVGQELLELDVDGEKIPFYQKVATELAAELELEVIPSNSTSPTLDDVAFAFRDQGGDLLDVSYQVAEILESLSDTIPEPLRKLAEIRHFNLFISVTPDSTLKSAIDHVRFGGQSRTVELAYSPMTELTDLPDDFSPTTSEVPTIFQMFGNAKFAPDYVVTEDDLLKYVNTLQSHDHRPDNLLDVLHPRSLAWIGTSYPDWLIRFLLCSAKGESLFVAKSARGYVADRKTSKDLALRNFLNRHQALLYETGDAISFVDELHARWMERFADDDGANEPAAVMQAAEASFPRNGVFISYASEDLTAATNLRDALATCGIQAWLDKQELRGGDRWESVIRESIESCSIFLPIISRHTETLERRFFRMEWNLAVRESEVRPRTFPFIQPIVVDETSIESEHIPREFRERHCDRFPQGIPDNDFLQRTKMIIRDLNRQRKRNS